MRRTALWLFWCMAVHTYGGGVNGASDDAVPELPPSEGHTKGVTQLEFGKKVKLEGLGPIIVLEDCTMRRIDNWDGLSKQERDAAWRRIAKRNSARLMICREREARGELEAESGELPSFEASHLLDVPVVEDWDTDDELRASRIDAMVNEEL